MDVAICEQLAQLFTVLGGQRDAKLSWQERNGLKREDAIQEH